MISLLTSSTRRQRENPPTGGNQPFSSDDGSSSSDAVEDTDESTLVLFTRLVSDGMPHMDSMLLNYNSALASTAFLSEMCEAVGWENALAFSM